MRFVRQSAGVGEGGHGGLAINAHLPHARLVNLAHGVAIEAAPGVHHGLDLVAARHVLVDLEADVAGRPEGCRVGLRPPPATPATPAPLPPVLTAAIGLDCRLCGPSRAPWRPQGRVAVLQPCRRAGRAGRGTCLKMSFPLASRPSYTAGMPRVEMVLLMGPVMQSTDSLNACSSLRAAHQPGQARCAEIPGKWEALQPAAAKHVDAGRCSGWPGSVVWAAIGRNI